MKPIAWYDPTNGMVSTDKDSPLFTPLGQVLPLYPQTAHIGFMDSKLNPIQRKPLSDEEILTYKYMIDWTAEWSYINFARAIEAAHGIKEKNNG